MITPKGNLTQSWTAARSHGFYEEGDWGWDIWLFDVNHVFVPKLLKEAIAALPAVAMVYGWDGKKWSVVPWTVPGDVPALIGYHGGPLHVCTSHDPMPVGDPKAGVQMAGGGAIVTGGSGGNRAISHSRHDAPCIIMDCYIECQP